MPDMTEEILQTIRDTIKETVNGKIDRIDFKVEAQGKLLTEHIAEHKQDREDMKPVIESFKNKTWLTQSIARLLILSGSFGGILAGVAAIVDILTRVH